MRFKRLKIVTVIVIVVVLSMCVCVALVRKFVIPAPPGNRHAALDLPRTKIATPELTRFSLENHKSMRLVSSTIEIIKV